MKCFIAVIVLALIAFANSETCKTTQDCVSHGITSCGGSYHVVCHNFRCECLQTDSTGVCTVQSDCPDCDGGRRKHCVDGRCRCSRF